MHVTKKIMIPIAVIIAMIALYMAIFYDVTRADHMKSQGELVSYFLDRGIAREMIEHKFAVNDQKVAGLVSLNHPKKLPATQIDFAAQGLGTNDLGVSIELARENVFYPFEAMKAYEVVNDTVAGQPILVAYCTVCKTGVIYDRSVAGVVKEFEAMPYLWENSLIMRSRNDADYDVSDGEAIDDVQYWVQASGFEVVGELAEDVPLDHPIRLDFRSFEIETLADFLDHSPDGQVLLNQ